MKCKVTEDTNEYYNKLSALEIEREANETVDKIIEHCIKMATLLEERELDLYPEEIKDLESNIELYLEKIEDYSSNPEDLNK